MRHFRDIGGYHAVEVCSKRLLSLGVFLFTIGGTAQAGTAAAGPWTILEAAIVPALILTTSMLPSAFRRDVHASGKNEPRPLGPHDEGE